MARPISDEELQLRRRARRRLIGAIVLVSIIVVALPMVLDTEPQPVGGDVSIRIPSSDTGNFSSRVVPVAPPGEKKQESAAKPSTEMKPAPKVAAAPEGKKPASAAPPAARAGTPVEEKAAQAAAAPAKTDNSASRQVPPKEPASAPFVVQVVALADAEKAKQVQAQVAAAGVQAYTEVVKTAKGDVTRVRAGPFPTRAAAEKARDQLQAAGLSGNVVSK